MAYAEQIFTNLGTVQQPDASQSTSFTESPFALSESTNQLLNQVTQNAVKKREAEVETFNKNLQANLSNLNKVPEGLNPQDYEEASKKSKEAIKFIYENPQILIGKDPQKSKQFNDMLVDIASFTQLSKGTKKIEDTYTDLIKKDSDWNNSVNNYYLEEWRKLSPQEKAKNSWTPIKSTEGDFTTTILPKILATSPTTTYTEIDPNDAGSQLVISEKVVDEGTFKDAYKSYNGLYLSEEWKTNPQIQAQYPEGADQYIEAKASLAYQPKIRVSTKSVTNREYAEGKKDARLETTIESRESEGAKNRDVKERIAEARVKSIKDRENYPDVKSFFDGVSQMKTENKIEVPPNIKGFENIEVVEEMSKPTIPPNIDKTLYTGSKDQYGDAYGKLYRVTFKDGSVKYAPAKQVYMENGKQVDRSTYNKSTSTKKSSYSTINETKLFTEDELAGKVLGGNKISNKQYQDWRKNSDGYYKEAEGGEKKVYKYDKITGYVDEFKGMGIGIGSIDSGGHNKGSLHGKTLAVDLPQSKNGGVEGLRKLLPILREKYPELDIVDEIEKPAGQKVWTGAHIHIEMDGKNAEFPTATKTTTKQTDLRKKYNY